MRRRAADPLAARWGPPALGLCVLALAACAPAPRSASLESPSESLTAGAPSPAPSTSTVLEYRPGLPAELRSPTDSGPAPLVVLVPGGGWATADPTGLVPLAERLTADGMSTSLITYSTTDSGSTFPAAVDDVACAIRWSAQQAADGGHPPTHVIALGHSAGGHLASLVTLSGEEFGGECPYPPTSIDGLIGLAGVYDIRAFESVMASWMRESPSESPGAWRRANPTAWLLDGTEVPEDLRVLLVHGDADVMVPVSQTTTFADALEAAGVDVTSAVLEGVDHMEVFEAARTAPLVRSWLDDGTAD